MTTDSGKKQMMHKLIHGPIFRYSCGIKMNGHSRWHWRFVTCKNCLKKVPKRKERE